MSSAARPSFRRRQLLVRKDVQLRTLAYFLGSAVISSFLTAFLISFGRDADLTPSSLTFVFIVFGFGFVLTCWIVLGMYFTNRVFGPIYRVQKEIRAMARGEGYTPISLRNGDYFADLVDDLNRLNEAISNGDLKSKIDHGQI